MDVNHRDFNFLAFFDNILGGGNFVPGKFADVDQALDIVAGNIYLDESAEIGNADDDTLIFFAGLNFFQNFFLGGNFAGLRDVAFGENQAVILAVDLDDFDFQHPVNQIIQFGSQRAGELAGRNKTV